jgi:hypothetical protein
LDRKDLKDPHHKDLRDLRVIRHQKVDKVQLVLHSKEIRVIKEVTVLKVTKDPKVIHQ